MEHRFEHKALLILAIFLLVVCSFLTINQSEPQYYASSYSKPEIETETYVKCNKTIIACVNRHPTTNSTSICYRPSIGRVDIWIGVRNETYNHMYGVALQTMRCYAQRNGYVLHLVDLTNHDIATQYCGNFSDDVSNLNNNYYCYCFRLSTFDVTVFYHIICVLIHKSNGGWYWMPMLWSLIQTIVLKNTSIRG
jgi:hypothetical protein